VDDAGHDTPNLEGCLGRHFEKGIGRILGSEVESTILEAKPFDGQLPIHGGNYDFSRPRLYCPINNQDVPGLDAGVTHGIAACPNIKSGRRVADEQFVEVEGSVQVVLGRARETGRNRGQIQR